MKRDRGLALVILCVLLLSVSGCWSRRETQQMNLSTALGFDRVMINDKEQWHLSVLSSKPQGGGGTSGGSSSVISEPKKGLTVQVTTVSGETLWDATRNWNLRASRRLFLGQVLLVVIGEDTARAGIQQILDYLLRHQDIRGRIWVIVCQGSASDFLNAQPEFEPTISQEIEGIIRDTWYRSGKVIGIDLFKTTYALLTPGKEIVLPYMQLFVPPEPSSPISSNAGGTNGSNTGDTGPQGKSFTISGSAIFRGDRMVGHLNDEETQGLSFLSNNFHSGTIPLSMQSVQKNASLRIGGSKTKVMVGFDQGTPSISVTIKAQGDFLEEDDSVFHVTTQDFKAAEMAANREIESRCRKALTKSQTLNADILGFGDKIHRSYPQEWTGLKDHWNDAYPDLQVSIKADCKIKQTGVISDPITIK